MVVREGWNGWIVSKVDENEGKGENKWREDKRFYGIGLRYNDVKERVKFQLEYS